MSESIIFYPNASSGIYWVANDSTGGKGSDGDSANGNLYFGNRISRVTFSKSSFLNLFGCSDESEFRKIKIESVNLSINFNTDVENDSIKILFNNDKTYINNNYQYWKSIKVDNNTNKKNKNYNMTEEMFSLSDLNDTFYLWINTYGIGTSGTFIGSKTSSGANRIHLVINYLTEYYTPSITNISIPDVEYERAATDANITLSSSISFAMPNKNLWPKEYSPTFYLKCSLSKDDMEMDPTEGGTTEYPSYSKAFDLNITKKDGVQEITFQIIAKFKNGDIELAAESIIYTYRLRSGSIPLSFSPKGNGVSIGSLIELEDDKPENARFECHYPIVIFADSEEIPKSYDGDAPKGTGINGQLFFKLSDTTGSGWKQLIPYMYYEDTTTTTNESVTETTSESE